MMARLCAAASPGNWMDLLLQHSTKTFYISRDKRLKRRPTFDADGYACRHQQHTRLRAMKGAASGKTALHVCGYQLVVVASWIPPASQAGNQRARSCLKDVAIG
ncbi:unnamed protein product, partial [Ectocarpus sp. 12 AP-2014]